MPDTFRRTTHTWLLYLTYAIFGYVINALGPVTPFLKTELNLSYTVGSLLFSAFAMGTILAGLGAHLLVARLGRAGVLWLGLFGMCASALGLAAARSAGVVLAAAFLTGGVGSLCLSVIQAGLSDEHGELRAVALSESTLVAATAAAAAPLMVGWFSYTALGWRAALGLPAAAALILWLATRGRVTFAQGSTGQAAEPTGQPLPGRYWALWAVILLAVAVEYCMLSWCADYLVNVAGLERAVAAQLLSLFIAGQILGRLAGSRILLRFSAVQVISASILLAGVGFALFWSALTPWITVVGLFLTGLGSANQFPMALSLALGAAPGNAVKASTRASLASGIAIFSLPLLLGRLADAAGIRAAYGLIAVLLAAALAIVWVSGGREKPINE